MFRLRLINYVYGRLQLYRGLLWSYMTVFRRITCACITKIYLWSRISRKTVANGETRSKTEIVDRLRIQRLYMIVFLAPYGHIPSFTTRRHTIVIRSQVYRRISSYTIVYNCERSFWAVYNFVVQFNINRLTLKFLFEHEI